MLMFIFQQEIFKRSCYEDELGKIVSNLAQGMLVTDEIVFEVLKERLKQDDIKKGFILDGFPRNLEQAIKYDEIIDELDISLGKVILLNILKRCYWKTGRRTCGNCGAIYNIYNPELTPKKEGICDKCDSDLSQRSDDNAETFNVRFKTYLSKTEPLIEYYKAKDDLFIVDASIDSKYTLEQVENL